MAVFMGKMIEPSKQWINDDKCTFWDWRWIMVNQWIYGLSSRFSEPKLVANGWQNPWKGYGKKGVKISFEPCNFSISLTSNPSAWPLWVPGASNCTSCGIHPMPQTIWEWFQIPSMASHGLWQNESINIYIYIIIYIIKFRTGPASIQIVSTCQDHCKEVRQRLTSETSPSWVWSKPKTWQTIGSHGTSPLSIGSTEQYPRAPVTLSSAMQSMQRPSMLSCDS